MSDATPAFDFSQFVPGFDFLKNLAAGAAASGQGTGSMPGLASWVAPTLNVEEVDKRIQELKTVQYWLEQNGHALKATIQALEVQKMTLSTLRGMNVQMEDLANAFTRHASAATAAVMPSASAAPATAPAPSALSTPMTSFFGRMAQAVQPPAAEEASAPAPTPEPSGRVDSASTARADDSQPGDAQDAQDPRDAAGAMAGVVDPLQWWGSLTQQFQQIAESAMKDAAQMQMPQIPQMPQMPTVSGRAKAAKAGATTSTGAAKAADAQDAKVKKTSGAGTATARTKAAAGARSATSATKAAPRKSATPARRSRG